MMRLFVYILLLLYVITGCTYGPSVQEQDFPVPESTPLSDPGIEEVEETVPSSDAADEGLEEGEPAPADPMEPTVGESDTMPAPTVAPAPSPAAAPTPGPVPKPAPKPAVSPPREMTPSPAPLVETPPTPSPAPEPESEAYLDSMAKGLLESINHQRRVKLAWSSSLETIAKERAREVETTGNVKLTDPAHRLDALKVAYGFCSYGQTLYPGLTPDRLQLNTLMEGFADKLLDESHSHVGIGIYHTPKGIAMAFMLVGHPTYQAEYLASVEQEILTLVNKEREAAGLAALKWSNPAHKVARDKVMEMYTRNYFAHESPYTGNLQKQFEVFGGLIMGSNVASIGENLAYAKGYDKGKLTAQYWVTQWMNSPGHRDNILNEGFTHMGAGVYFGEDGRAYAAQAFCTPK